MQEEPKKLVKKPIGRKRIKNRSENHDFSRFFGSFEKISRTKKNITWKKYKKSAQTRGYNPKKVTNYDHNHHNYINSTNNNVWLESIRNLF